MIRYLSVLVLPLNWNTYGPSGRETYFLLSLQLVWPGKEDISFNLIQILAFILVHRNKWKTLLISSHGYRNNTLRMCRFSFAHVLLWSQSFSCCRVNWFLPIHEKCKRHYHHRITIVVAIHKQPIHSQHLEQFKAIVQTEAHIQYSSRDEMIQAWFHFIISCLSRPYYTPNCVSVCVRENDVPC